MNKILCFLDFHKIEVVAQYRTTAEGRCIQYGKRFVSWFGVWQ